MYLRHLGYVGQNLTLNLTTGRTLRLRNLDAERAAAVTAENLAALGAILRWNVDHGIRFFRVATGVVPFASHPTFDLDWEERFAQELDALRTYVRQHGLRVTMHPGQYTVLNSPRDDVAIAARAELAYGARFLAHVDPEGGTLTLHVGGAYGDRERAKARFVARSAELPPEARARLTVENDDALFDLDDALEVAEAAGLPMVFDRFHHDCHHRRDDPLAELPRLLARAVATWGGRTPKMHLSSARTVGATAHADYVEDADLEALRALLGRVEGNGPVDVMLEAKAKERAVLAHLGAAGAA